MSNVGEVTVTSPELALLQMIIENDQQQAEADKLARRSAREAQREAMQEELEALEEQADAIRTGAALQGGLQIAGGCTSIDGIAEGDTAMMKEGEMYSGLAQPAGALYRGAEVDAQRDAQAADQTQQQASWLAEDAEAHREEVQRHAQAMLQQVQGILETQHQTTVAVLSNG